MIFLRKKIFLILLLVTIPIMALFYHISNPINPQNSIVYGKENEIIKYTEKISPLITQENNDLICDSSTGTCCPPPGWY